MRNSEKPRILGYTKSFSLRQLPWHAAFPVLHPPALSGKPVPAVLLVESEELEVDEVDVSSAESPPRETRIARARPTRYAVVTDIRQGDPPLESASWCNS